MTPLEQVITADSTIAVEYAQKLAEIFATIGDYATIMENKARNELQGADSKLVRFQAKGEMKAYGDVVKKCELSIDSLIKDCEDLV